MKIKIRKFRKADATQVLALNSALQATHGVKATITAKHFVEACLHDKLADCFVAVAEGKIVSFSNSHDWINLGNGTRICTVDQLCTDDKYRRHGIGSALMRRMAEEAIARGCSRLEVSAAKDNKAANALYKKTGLSPRKSQTNKYILEGKSLPQFVRYHLTKAGRRSKSNGRPRREKPIGNDLIPPTWAATRPVKHNSLILDAGTSKHQPVSPSPQKPPRNAAAAFRSV